MSDSDEEFCATYIPYSERPEWADVIPITQDDGPNPIVAIHYSAHFREIYDYVRAVIAKEEKSMRALELTEDALHLNPANYTVWLYRRKILEELGCDLQLELDYLDDVIRLNAKNYQVWHHRRVICELLNDGSRELQLTETALDSDAKNYHAWQHRQWAIHAFDLYANELDFVEKHISLDQRNNSAWNQRFFVFKHFGFTADIIQSELEYTIQRLLQITKNESAWNYLTGIMRHGKDDQLNSYPNVIKFAESLYNKGNRSPHLLAYLVDLYQELSLKKGNGLAVSECNAYKVYKLCNELAEEHDVVRRKYWKYVADSLKAKFPQVGK